MPDTALRAITDDGAFRVIAVRTTDTVREAILAQKVSGDAARLFADLLTGAILIRETMAPDLRVQAILQADDRASRMVADAHPDGTSRGLVQLTGEMKARAAKGESIPIAKGGLLQVARTMHNGALHQGTVSVPPSASGNARPISAALMAYMQESEQVVSMIAVGTDTKDGVIQAAAGYIVQLLPEVGEGPLAVMTERMRDFEAIEPLFASGAAEPDALLREILWGMPWTTVGTDPLKFGCNCSQARVVASLATLPKREIAAMVQDGRVLEIGCDYCGSQYQVAPEQLRGLLEAH
jgi:molecular chaperone Hsp33